MSRKVRLYPCFGYKAWSLEINRKNLQREARKRNLKGGRSGQQVKDIKQVTADTNLNLSGECSNRR